MPQCQNIFYSADVLNLTLTCACPNSFHDVSNALNFGIVSSIYSFVEGFIRGMQIKETTRGPVRRKAIGLLFVFHMCRNVHVCAMDSSAQLRVIVRIVY